MKIVIDDNSGFCFGVQNAVSLAEDILDKEGQLYCLGELVHNPVELERLTRKGLEIIDQEAFKHLRNSKVLLRAHGEPPETYRIAFQNGLS